MTDVSVVACASYDEAEVTQALKSVLEPLGGLDWVKKGMRIAIKANLVSMMKPELAATTHPALLCALVKMPSQSSGIAPEDFTTRRSLTAFTMSRA